MPDLFKEIIPSILQTKKSVIHDDIDAKDYTPFVVNRALSYHMDCVLYANGSMKRKFQPWQKTEADKNIDCVKTHFGYSNQKAKEALRILNDDQIAEIKRRTDKGGI
jgi:hypothetical protein